MTYGAGPFPRVLVALRRDTCRGGVDRRARCVDRREAQSVRRMASRCLAWLSCRLRRTRRCRNERRKPHPGCVLGAATNADFSRSRTNPTAHLRCRGTDRRSRVRVFTCRVDFKQSGPRSSLTGFGRFSFSILRPGSCFGRQLSKAPRRQCAFPPLRRVAMVRWCCG